jgi:hypothetical protein
MSHLCLRWVSCKQQIVEPSFLKNLSCQLMSFDGEPTLYKAIPMFLLSQEDLSVLSHQRTETLRMSKFLIVYGLGRATFYT